MDRATLLDRLEEDLPYLRQAEEGRVFAIDLYEAELVVVGDLDPFDQEDAEEFAAEVTRDMWKYSINGLKGPEDLGGRVMKKWLVVELWIRAKRFAEKERYKVEKRTPGLLTRLKWWLTDAGPS